VLVRSEQYDSSPKNAPAALSLCPTAAPNRHGSPGRLALVACPPLASSDGPWTESTVLGLDKHHDRLGASAVVLHGFGTRFGLQRRWED
jgi:hypothetical protein